MKRLFAIVAALPMIASVTNAEAADSKHKVELFAAGRCYTVVSRPENSDVVTDYVCSNPCVSHPSCRPSRSESAKVPVGSEVTANMNFLGTEQGFVVLRVGNATFECRVTSWDRTSVTFEVPDMGLIKSTDAEFQVLRSTGSIIKAFGVTLTKKPELIVHDGSSVSPSAGQVADESIADTHGLVMSSPEGGASQVAVNSNQ